MNSESACLLASGGGGWLSVVVRGVMGPSRRGSAGHFVRSSLKKKQERKEGGWHLRCLLFTN